MRLKVTPNGATASLLLAFVEWDGFLANPNYVRRDPEITWNGYKERKFLNVVLASDVANLSEQGQYSFQVKDDGSIFQIQYLFDRRKRYLLKATLSFYCSGNYYLSESDIEWIDDQLIPAPDIPVGWIRIDYDSSNTANGGVSHAPCHMHLSLLPNARLIVDRVPNPRQFVEFVIAICYPSYYKEFRLDAKGKFGDFAKMCKVNNPLTHALNLDEICSYIPHLRIPTATIPPMNK